MADQTLSFYIGLKPNSKADLRALGSAMICLDTLAKEVGFFADASAPIDIEFDSSEQGSVRINAVVRIVKDRLSDKKYLYFIAGTILAWLADDVRSYLTERVISEALEIEEGRELSADEIREIASQVADAVKNEIGKDTVDELVGHISTDENVTGFGISPKPEGRPRYYIPRERFSDILTSEREELLEEEATRTRTDVLPVTLVSPVLIPSKRRWRFRSHEGEFGATILDQDFLLALLRGETSIPMTQGIEMIVELETKDVLEDGAWRPERRTVKRVIEIRPRGSQSELLFDPDDPVDDD